MTGRMILVSSFPKSGNTWARAVLEQLRRGPDWQFSINEMPTGYYGASHRLLFDAMSPVNASDLVMDEIYNMLPKVYAELAKEDAINILKVHDTCRRVSTGEWLYPADSVYSVIYLVRHPFDVAVSFAPHMNLPLDEAVTLMGEGLVNAEATTGLELPLPQYLDSWTDNVTSWLDESPHRVTLARYEDMYADPMAQFRRIAHAAGFDPSDEELARVLGTASFENMRDEEKAGGFRERPKTSTNFFREGKPGGWQGKLDESLREKIVRDHGAVMARLGYLPDGGVTDMPGAA